MKRPAFTLLEMLIVVVVMALIATSASLGFKKPLQRAAQSDAIAELKHVDRAARQAAVQLDRPMQLRFDLEKQAVSRIENDASTATMHLPHGIRIAELRTADHRIQDFEHQIAISKSGISMTYAVHLTGTDFDQWILFAGLTGEYMSGINENDMDNIFATLSRQSTQRTDAR